MLPFARDGFATLGISLLSQMQDVNESMLCENLMGSVAIKKSTNKPSKPTACFSVLRWALKCKRRKKVINYKRESHV